MDLFRRRSLLAAGALAGGLALAGCSRKPQRGSAVPAGATVLALGDSLTYGTGASADTAYPTVLAGLTGWQVVNAGVPGNTTAQAAARWPALAAEHQPALVLLCVGGNDFLRRLPEADTRAQLRALCEAIRASGAQLLLIAVPRPSLAAAFMGSLDDHVMYGEIAEALQLPLHRQGWSEVLADEQLRADSIHANAQGYARFAQGLMATLRASGLYAG